MYGMRAWRKLLKGIQLVVSMSYLVQRRGGRLGDMSEYGGESMRGDGHNMYWKTAPKAFKHSVLCSLIDNL